MKTFKLSQRVKRGMLRGTIIEVLRGQKFETPVQYIVRMDNGARVLGTAHQFTPVRGK